MINFKVNEVLRVGFVQQWRYLIKALIHLLIGLLLVTSMGCDKADVNLSSYLAEEKDPSLSKSVLTLSNGSVAVSGSVSLQLTLHDEEGERIFSGGHEVVFYYSGGTSLGFITPPEDNDDGTYSATFTGTASGTRIYFTATIDDQTITSSSPSVEVTP